MSSSSPQSSKSKDIVVGKTKILKVQPQTSSAISSILYLKQSEATFDAPSQKVSVFFDECNHEIISLTSGLDSKTKVIFHTMYRDGVKTIQFLLPVEKRILSIKLNSTRTILAYHVEKSNVEFINIKSTTSPSDNSMSYEFDDRRYVQASKAKNSKLLGFLWTGPTDLVMITDISIEYYHVDANKRRLKHIKSFQSSTNWFVYQPPYYAQSETEKVSQPYSILMVSTGSLGNSIQPYMFCNGQLIKLQRFDVEGDWHGSDKIELFERSITIARIYGQVRLLVLQHESLNIRSKGAQILVYTVDIQTGITNKTHTLDLDVSGRFAINILDNLVVAHDQPSKSSFIFDIMIESTEKSDCPKHFVSLLGRQPIRPLHSDTKKDPPELYSLNWVFFQPNFIIDAKLGLLCSLHLDLESVCTSIQDNSLLLSFLALRKESNHVILSKIKEIVGKSHRMLMESSQRQSSPLADVSSTFEVSSKLVISALELNHRVPLVTGGGGGDRQLQQDLKANEQQDFSSNTVYSATINQEDFHREILRQLDRPEWINEPAHIHFVTSTLLEFIFMVRKQEKNVEFCIYEQLVKCLVDGGRFYQLVQMIKSEVFKDSKQLACLLLSLKNQHRVAAILGMDMLHRLQCIPKSPSRSQLESLCLGT